MQEDAEGRLDVGFVDDGEQRLKNIARPVRVYRVGSIPPPPSRPRRRRGAAGRRPTDVPSIAVLPFQNLSADPEQDYFADGIVDEIITGLSRYRALFVIARNSTFTYKGRAVDVKQVGRELDVRYVLEGSVRKAGNRIRISGQLVDAATAGHLWADRFEGGLEDIFDLQDRVAASVVGALVPQIRAGRDRARAPQADREPRCAHHLHARLAPSIPGAERASTKRCGSAYRAIELDPNYARLTGIGAELLRGAQDGRLGRPTPPRRSPRPGGSAQVAEVGHDDFFALASCGFALANVLGELERGRPDRRGAGAQPERVVPPHPERLRQRLAGRAGGRDPAPAARHAHSPVDSLMFIDADRHGLAHFLAGRDDEALAWAEKALQRNPIVDSGHPHRRRQRGHARPLRRRHEVLALLGPARSRPAHLQPGERITLRRPQDRERLADGLRQAGLPE